VDHREAILQAARELRVAIRKRRGAASAALDAYDGATGDRLNEAVAFLQAIKASDDVYEEARSLSLERYARHFGSWREGR
jgi:hypothetical protein